MLQIFLKSQFFFNFYYFAYFLLLLSFRILLIVLVTWSILVIISDFGEYPNVEIKGR